MPDSKRAVAALGVTIDPQTRDIVLLLKGEDGAPFQVNLLPAIVAGIAVTLFGFGNRIATHDSGGLSAQVMNLAGVAPAVGPQKQPVLDLILEGGLHFPVTFPKEAIAGLQNALSRLLVLSSSQKPEPRN